MATKVIPEDTSRCIEMIAQIVHDKFKEGNEAIDWMKSPQERYHGYSPLDYITKYDDGAQRVLKYVLKGIFLDRTKAI